MEGGTSEADKGGLDGGASMKSAEKRTDWQVDGLGGGKEEQEQRRRPGIWGQKDWTYHSLVAVHSRGLGSNRVNGKGGGGGGAG